MESKLAPKKVTGVKVTGRLCGLVLISTGARVTRPHRYSTQLLRFRKTEKIRNTFVAPIDLNAAATHELNAAGGGLIGRAIIRGRPYTSVDELLTKRVVNRATFDIIWQRIGVRT